MPEAATATQMSPAEFVRVARVIEDEVGKIIVGQQEIVRGILTCVLAGGHALLEGVPGLGKTMLVRTLGQVLDLSFSRIQFTPDLMPADITGTNLLAEDGAYPLPEAQLDRFFFKLHVGFPTGDELLQIAERTTTGHMPEVASIADGP